MPWYIVPYRRARLCIPYWGGCDELTLERLYPSRETIGVFTGAAENLCCIEVDPVVEGVAAYRVVDREGYNHDVVTLHYYSGDLPTSVSSIIAVTKLEGDGVSGRILDAQTGRIEGSITFEDKGEYAIGRFVLQRRGLYYALIYLADGLLVEPVFFRPRVRVSPALVLFLGLAMGGRRVVLVG